MLSEAMFLNLLGSMQPDRWSHVLAEPSLETSMDCLDFLQARVSRCRCRMRSDLNLSWLMAGIRVKLKKSFGNRKYDLIIPS